MIRDTVHSLVAPEPPQGTLSIDDAMQLLANRRRRCMLDILDEIGAASKRGLAEAVATVLGEDYKPVYVAIHQTHLPRLQACDVLEADERDDVITPGKNFDACLAFIDEAEQRFDGGGA